MIFRFRSVISAKPRLQKEKTLGFSAAFEEFAFGNLAANAFGEEKPCERSGLGRQKVGKLLEDASHEAARCDESEELTPL